MSFSLQINFYPLGTSWQQGEYCVWCVNNCTLMTKTSLSQCNPHGCQGKPVQESEVFSLVSALALFLIFLDPIPRFFTPAARLTQDLIWEDGKMASIGFHHLREIAFSPRDHFPAFVLTHPDNNLIHNELLAATLFFYHLSYMKMWKLMSQKRKKLAIPPSKQLDSGIIRIWKTFFILLSLLHREINLFCHFGFNSTIKRFHSLYFEVVVCF